MILAVLSVLALIAQGQGLVCYVCVYDTAVIPSKSECRVPYQFQVKTVTCTDPSDVCITEISYYGQNVGKVERKCGPPLTTGVPCQPFESGNCFQYCSEDRCNTFRDPQALLCYDCTYQSALGVIAECEGPGIDNSYLESCSGLSDACLTAATTLFDTNTVTRSCGSSLTPEGCVDSDILGKTCTSKCDKDGCNNEEFTPNGEHLDCYHCQYNSSDPQTNECKGPDVPDYLLVNCTTSEFCSVATVTQGEEVIGIDRRCGGPGGDDQCQDVENGATTCISFCAYDGCNTAGRSLSSNGMVLFLLIATGILARPA